MTLSVLVPLVVGTIELLQVASGEAPRIEARWSADVVE